MSNKDTGGPAFPSKGNEMARQQAAACGVQYTEPSGMTLRDYFAAKAMQSMCAEVARYDDFFNVAKAAYKMADSMLEARK